MNVIDKMREDWNRRARQDANFYVAFADQKQKDEDFLATASEVVTALEGQLFRLPAGPPADRRALEIGCGPGRLMIPMSRHFGQIHGVDISDEMVALAKRKLASIQGAQVHVNSGSDLGMFTDDFFDFVYSWIVFQHIPSKEVVLSYLREAQRVLKPGGVMVCQLRGVSPIATELKPGSETWTGCWFTAEEVMAFSGAQGFPLVAIWGIATQYMVTVFRKASGEPAEMSPERTVLKSVTAAASGERRVPARGAGAAVSLWIDGFPRDGGLAEFPVLFGGTPQTGCFLSPVSASGGCQLNARLPEKIQPGRVPVQLSYRGNPIGGACEIEVLPAPPRNPKVLRVTDSINPQSVNRIQNGIKVTIEDLERPEDVSFLVGGREAGFVLTDCADPTTSTFIFGFPIPHKTKRGATTLTVRVQARELTAVSIDIV